MIDKLSLIETFVIFAESKNIFETADKLNISQPSVSLRLKALEDLFGKGLFTLKGKKKVLTHQGRTLYQQVAPMIHNLYQSMHKFKKSISSLDEMNIKIACRRELFYEISQHIIFPGSYELLSCDSKKALDLVLNNKVDFAISHSIPNTSELTGVKISEEGYHFVIHKSLINKKASIRSFYNINFLEQTPFIQYDENFSLIDSWLNHYEIEKNTLNRKMTIGDWNIIIDLVSQGKGFSLTPKAFQSNNKDVLYFPIKEAIIPPITLYLLQRVDSTKVLPRKKVFSF